MPWSCGWFNRYIVECKSETTEDDIHVELDLIDT